MKKAGVILALFTLCFSATALITRQSSIGVEATLHQFKADTKTFIASLQSLQSGIQNLQANNPASVKKAKQSLVQCRAAYKKLEGFVEYFFENRIRIFNGAPVHEVEEPYMEYQSPVGLQVVEELLFDKAPEQHKQELLAQVEVMLTTAEGFPSYLHGKTITDEAVLESVRLQLIRIIALGITGYDAPQLKTGITEAAISMNALEQAVQPYLNNASSKRIDSVRLCFLRSHQLLSQPVSFNSIDRLQFLTQAALPLQEQLNLLINELHLKKEGVTALNYDAKNIYQRNALRLAAFTKSEKANADLIALGKKLFFEKGLSGNGKRSCATCHKPENYFTDGLRRSAAFDGHAKLSRNTPSLLYAAYQHNQFWDGGSETLQAQIETVLMSEAEMNAGLRDFRPALSSNNSYRQLFKKNFSENDSLYSIANIAKAIAAYECSLPVMTSAFDDYMNGNKAALSQNAIKGFNLFMGKAQCGTCHFAPLFNSLLPPLYNRSEVESLGLTASANFRKPVADADSGRYGILPIAFYRGVFKTPTVRNAAKTAPYMHNGAFKTLEQVIEFYDKGGGAGLGLHSPQQTLSAKPLHLTKKEKACLVAFLHSLTDKNPRP